MLEISPQNPSHLSRVYAEQIRLTYQQLPMLTISNVIGSLLLAFVVSAHISQTVILIWLGIQFIIAAVGASIVVRVFNLYGQYSDNYQLWGKILVVYGCIRAIAWGSAGFIFYIPDLFEYQILLTLFIIGAAGLVAAQGAAYKPLFYAITLPVLLPISLRLGWELDALHAIVAFMVLLYGVALAYFYQKIYAMIKESLLLRFEKASLAEDLERQKKAAVQAFEDKSRFIAAVSHDLRQPLHAQGLFVAELKHHIKRPATVEIVAKLEGSLNAMHSLFNSLLDISKLDVQAIKPVFKQFPIAQIFNDIVLDFHAEAHAKGLVLKVVQSQCWIYSDPQLLVRIMRNLIANAVEYTDKGRVLLGCRRKGNQLVIEVWDTGIGIPPEEFDNVFKEYHQLNVPNYCNKEHAGLGLAIVAKFCGLLHHTVNVKSRLGQGSVFSVCVPMATKIAENLPKMSSISPISAAWDFTKKNLLLIDDDVSYLQTISQLLTSWDCTTILAANQDDVLRILQQGKNNFDLIITDYHLQAQVTGLALIQLVRRTVQKDIPAIIITGDTSSIVCQKIKAENIHVLNKPVQPAKLRALMSFLSNNGNAGDYFPRNSLLHD